jgi:hypothetical protein
MLNKADVTAQIRTHAVVINHHHISLVLHGIRIHVNVLFPCQILLSCFQFFIGYRQIESYLLILAAALLLALIPQ